MSAHLKNTLNLIPKDNLNHGVLPYLDSSNLLNIRLVDSACRESVNCLMKDMRVAIHNPRKPRGGVFIQRSIDRVPQGLNDFQYMFRQKSAINTSNNSGHREICRAWPQYNQPKNL